MSKKYRTVSIVGMAKNCGKTTALNHLIEEAMDEGMILGITSTGRDGESIDLVTGTDKPRVYLYEGTLVSVPTQLYELAEAGLEILKMTPFRTSLGQLMLCRVAESGYVQIAGPVTTSEQKEMCREMLDRGVDMVLIDGAIDRRAIAAPDASDGIIVATGAVLSRSLKKVVEETVHIVELYRMPQLPLGPARTLIEANKDQEKIMMIDKDRLRILDLKTGLGSGRHLDNAMEDTTEYIYIPGAFTTSVINDMNLKKLKNIQFVLKDPTKIFIDATSWQQLLKKGMRITVLQNIQVAAVTVNPWSPGGYSFEHRELRDGVAAMLPDLPVVDVRHEVTT